MRQKVILETISIVELKPNEFGTDEEDAKGLATAIASKECELDTRPDDIDAEVEIIKNEEGKRVFTVKFYTYK